MRSLVLALAVLSAAALPALAQDVEGAARIRDADTLVVDGLPVRLNGVDAPERGTWAGEEAARYMQALVSGETVTCDLNGDRTYDRWVGICYVRGIDVGAALIAEGFALDCARYSGGRYRPLEPPGVRSVLSQAGYC